MFQDHIYAGEPDVWGFPGRSLLLSGECVYLELGHYRSTSNLSSSECITVVPFKSALKIPVRDLTYLK
jgi:hypothetical protein